MYKVQFPFCSTQSKNKIHRLSTCYVLDFVLEKNNLKLQENPGRILKTLLLQTEIFFAHKIKDELSRSEVEMGVKVGTYTSWYQQSNYAASVWSLTLKYF